MPRHARRKRSSTLKAVASGVVVVVFLAFAVGGAFGWIGAPGDSDDPSVTAVDPPASVPASDEPEPGASTTPTAGDDESQSIQKVKQAKKLKRTIAWLRRGLADETTFRVASLNVLGDSHTGRGGNKRGWASGVTRMGWAYGLLQSADIDVVGFQEFETPQYNRFRSLGGSSWAVFPGPTLDRGSLRDSIAWRTDTWELVEARSVDVPYFGGQMIRRPLVRLKNIESGREVWFFNTHNPATTPRWGNNARWRSVAISIEVRLADELSADGTPVIFTGDYNDRAEAFCPLTGQTSLVAAAGGTGDEGCVLPERPGVDWIFGSGVEFSGYASITSGVVGRITDHPFVYSQAYIPEEPLVSTNPSSDGAIPSPSPSASETAGSN
jgi:hypothetical protein